MLLAMSAKRPTALDRLLDPVADCFTVESAQRLLDLRLDDDTRASMEDLARKANEGTLSDSERQDYLDYVEAMDLIGILQAKAGRALAKRSA